MTEAGASAARAFPPRERMVRSAAQLIRRKGVSGTGMREIVTEAEAPRGSLQHYFPGGKEELVSDALLWMGDVSARRVKRCLSQLESRTPSALLAAIADTWRRDLTNEKFSAGCPLVAAAADTAATSEQLRQVLRRAFDGWLEPLSESLVDLGVPLERSGNLAIVIIAALEGAIILARIRRDLTPLDALVLELGPLLDSVALLRGLFALAGSGGAKVDEVAAVRGVVPDAGLVLRAVVEDHRAGGIPARFEAGPQLVLLGEEDVSDQGAGDLAPALALGREGKPPLIKRHLPAKLVEEACQVRLGPWLRFRSACFELGPEGLAQLVQGRQVVRRQAESCGPLKRTQPAIRRRGASQEVGLGRAPRRARIQERLHAPQQHWRRSCCVALGGGIGHESQRTRPGIMTQV